MLFEKRRKLIGSWNSFLVWKSKILHRKASQASHKNNLFRYRVLWNYLSTRPSRQLLLVSASHRNNLFRRDICTLKYLSTQSLCHLLLLSASLETPKQRQTLGIVILGLWIIFQLSPPVNFFKSQPPTNPEKARECALGKKSAKFFFFFRPATEQQQPSRGNQDTCGTEERRRT